MTEPIRLDQIRELNKQRLYGVLLAHRRRRGVAGWLLRRPAEVCVHTALGHKTPLEASRDAEALSLERPCVVALIDLEAGTLAGRWVTDPLVSDARLDEMEALMGGELDA